MKRYKKHIRYNQKAGFLYLFLAIIIGSMGMGYAYLTQRLFIEGKTTLSSANWNVHFENIQPVSGSVTPTVEPTITDDTNISFGANLANPSEFYAFTVDVVNEGSIDAMIDSFSLLPELTEAQSKYLSYKVTYEDGSILAEHQKLTGHSMETLKISFEYMDGVPLVDYPSENQNLSVMFSLNYEQADNLAESIRFSDDTWEQIVENVHNGKIPAGYTVGSTKELNMGSLGIRTARIVNRSTPEECGNVGFSQSACGFVIAIDEILTTRQMNASNSNGGGWPSTEIPSYLSTIVYNSLPDAVKNGIVSTSVVSGHSIYNASNFTSNDQIYLLSRREVFGYEGEEDSASSNTRQLDYYANGGGKVKVYRGNNTGWWLRSINSSSTKQFDSVTMDGTYQSSNANSTLGVSPVFRLG